MVSNYPFKYILYFPPYICQCFTLKSIFPSLVITLQQGSNCVILYKLQCSLTSTTNLKICIFQIYKVFRFSIINIYQSLIKHYVTDCKKSIPISENLLQKFKMLCSQNTKFRSFPFHWDILRFLLTSQQERLIYNIS